MKYFLIALLGFSLSWGQDALVLEKNQLNTARDIQGAIDISNYQKIIVNDSPDGNGGNAEVEAGHFRSNKFFPKEYNTTWFKIEVKTKSKCAFIIEPHKNNEDYDFLLLSTSNGIIKESDVIRSNLARPNNEMGWTGLKEKQQSNFVGSGVGNNYSNDLILTPNRTYYLVLNNVKGEKGANIALDIKPVLELKGQVKNDEGKPVQADLKWQEADVIEIQAVYTTDENGFYDIDLIYEADTNKSYILTVESEATFFMQQEFRSDNMEKAQDQDYVLITLQPGKKLDLTTVYFKGGLAEFEPFAFPTLDALYQLMNENPTLEIKIVGHVNGCQDENAFQLSKDRATVTQSFLYNKGIDESRIEVAGKGCTEMLYPMESKNAWKNRRIEIFVKQF